MNTTSSQAAEQSGQPIKRARRTKAAQQPAPEVNALFAEAEALGIIVPTWKRSVCAFVASTTLAAGVGYGAVQLGGYLIAGVLVTTGSALMSFITTALAMILCVYASLKVAERVGMYVLSGQIDRDIVRAKDSVVSLVGRAKSLIAF